MMYGREARLPLEVEKAHVDCDISELGDVQNAIDCLSRMREKIFSDASQNIKKCQQRQKDQYKRRKGLDHTTHLKAGDLVLRLNMIKRTKKGHKGEDTWTGPYKILDISKYGCCRLQCITTGNNIKRKVNVHQLKIYRDQESAVRGLQRPASVTGNTSI